MYMCTYLWYVILVFDLCAHHWPVLSQCLKRRTCISRKNEKTFLGNLKGYSKLGTDIHNEISSLSFIIVALISFYEEHHLIVVDYFQAIRQLLRQIQLVTNCNQSLRQNQQKVNNVADRLRVVIDILDPCIIKFK